ncbi:hypothetical protein ACT3TS_08395 [Specibacter sp. AOP5-B1-6]
MGSTTAVCLAIHFVGGRSPELPAAVVLKSMLGDVGSAAEHP